MTWHQPFARLRVAVLACNSLGAGLLAGAAWAEPFPLATHQAVYELSLDETGGTTSVSDAEGRMVYDISGSTCDGYTTKVRFVTRISDSDGNAKLTDASTTTFEDSAATKFTFSTKTYIDGTVKEDSAGSAERAGNDIRVTLTKPASKVYRLAPSFDFPNQHLETVLGAAVKGEHFIQINLFDGSESGEKSYSTSAVIGALNTGNDDLGDAATAKGVGIDGLRHWPVTLSYFDQDGTGEQSPSYELSFIIYENGIIRRMRLDYGDFALTGKLVKLTLKPTKVLAANCK